MMRLTGPWGEAAAITERMQARFAKGMVQATLKEAHHLRGWMVKGITSQAPGGLAFRPLSPATLALRQAMGFGGSKALIRTGALLANISVMRLPGASPKVFIGVLRQAKTKDGKPLANIAAMNEFGATIRKTDRMRRFLMAKLRGAGIKPSRAGGGGGGGGSIVIPARPFVRPVIQRYAKPADVKRRFYQNIADAMGGDFGRMAGRGSESASAILEQLDRKRRRAERARSSRGQAFRRFSAAPGRGSCCSRMVSGHCRRVRAHLIRAP